MTKRSLRRLFVLSGVLAAAVLIYLLYLRPKPIPITGYRVAAGRVEEIVTNSKAGTIMSRRRATLSTEIGGRVAALPVKAGDRVRTRDLLVQLADADYVAQLQLQERSLDAAAASQREAQHAADQAERDLARNRRLMDEGIISQGILDQSQTLRDQTASALDAARARALQARSAVDVARVNLQKLALRAPFDGVVAEVQTELGEWITPSPPGLPMPPVIELIDTSSLYVSTALDEVDVSKVRKGLPVRITLDALPGRSFPGRVTRVAPYVLDVEQQNRTFETEVEFDDPAAATGLPPGTSVDIAVILNARDGALRIPSYALMEGNRVMVVRDSRLAIVTVTTGLRNWEFTEITGGLAAGELVAVSIDRAEVKEGAMVRVDSETLK